MERKIIRYGLFIIVYLKNRIYASFIFIILLEMVFNFLIFSKRSIY